VFLPENKHLRFLLYILYAALALAGFWLVLRFLLPWLAPFLLAFLLAALLERPVKLCMNRLHLPRWGAACLCTVVLWGLACTVVGLLVWRLGYELALMLGRLPTLLAGLPSLASQAEGYAYRFLISLPVQFQQFAQEMLDGLLEQGISLPNRLYDWLAGLVSGAVRALPGVSLFLFTSALATGMISASRPTLMRQIAAWIPQRWHGPMETAGTSLRGALGGWLKAQGLLMLITFGELTAGLLILRVDLALLLAALIALVDALPVFGTGTVLLPWGLCSLISGQLPLAIGLFILYGAITLVRNLLEPKLVGSRVGLPPLAALAAMYVGFQALGVLGMILFPLLAVLLKRLWDSGLLPHSGGRQA
jgi:sporulation integral membrane protein YtvI